jgi:hypothetical protein
MIAADDAIVAAWKSYPVFAPELKVLLSETFEEMAAVHSFRFHDTAGRDGIWWNTLFQRSACEAVREQRGDAAN